MGKRVKIQYSIDLEELPDEVGNLLSRTEQKLATCHKDVQSMIKSYNHDFLMTTAATKEISELRENLMDVDLTLGDITNIIFSYVDYELRNQEEEPEPEPISDENIEKQIQNLKEALPPG
jgi:hypothetical protein